jgi:hypothetical protein
MRSPVNEGLGVWHGIVDYFRAAPPIFGRHYWDRPMPRDVGDPDPKAICEAVGHALSQWGLADQALADLFVSLTDTRSAQSCAVGRRSYYSIARHRDRRRAIGAAAEAYFSQYRARKVGGHYASRAYDAAHASYCRAHAAARQTVAATIAAVELAADRHDDIAHGITWENVRFDNRDLKSFLMPADYRTGERIAGRADERTPWGFTRSRYRYTSADIASFAGKFIVLRDRILDCARTVDLVTEQYGRYERSLPSRYNIY